jgi:hypothetical protein
MLPRRYHGTVDASNREHPLHCGFPLGGVLVHRRDGVLSKSALGTLLPSVPPQPRDDAV